NHHLFFADLALKSSMDKRGSGALPPYDAVIFDEAHEIEDVATSFFGVRLSRARIERMLRDADRAFLAAGLADRVLGKGEGTALTAIVAERTADLFDRVARLRIQAKNEGEARATLPRDVWKGDLFESYLAFDAILEALAGYAETNAVDEAVKLVSAR